VAAAEVDDFSLPCRAADGEGGVRVCVRGFAETRAELAVLDVDVDCIAAQQELVDSVEDLRR
jgi:hypothetical protein